MKHPLVKLIVTVILIVCMETSAFSYFPKPQTLEDTNPQLEACGAGVVIGLAALVVVGYIILKLLKFCKKHLPTAPPPPPPPCPTNSSPALITRSLTMPMSVMVIDDEAVDLIDVASYGWRDGSSNLFYVIAAVELQASTNLVNWQKELTITSWISPANVLSVYYNKIGAPILTNYCPATMDQSQMGAMPQLPIGAEQFKAFRLALPQ